MKNAECGQIFPFCLFLIGASLILILSNFEISFINLRKIQQQKTLDGVAFDYATAYARALNGLAALNQGLTIASQRGQMMATAYTLLGSCAPFVPACSKAFSKLSPQIRPFFHKLSKLGKSLAEQQEQIIQWMIDSRTIPDFQAYAPFDQFYIYPDFGHSFQHDNTLLPFFRPEQNLGHQLPFAFDVPPPLVFKKDFFLEKNRMIFVSSAHIDSVFKKIHPGEFRELPSKVWSISEIKIDGIDFQKMEFEPRLTRISLQKQLWSELYQKRSFQNWPSLPEFENEIAH